MPSRDHRCVLTQTYHNCTETHLVAGLGALLSSTVFPLAARHNKRKVCVNWNDSRVRVQSDPVVDAIRVC